MNIEITEEALAELLTHIMAGMQEVGEYTSTTVHTFKELANKLPDTAWNAQAIKEFANSLNDTVDGPDEDYSFILDPYNDEDDY